ncbi:MULTISPECIES: TIGR03571 family LLM class oxidoreductase [unclassified Methylophaga]|uniref:TIGR03571 family LLM class oxidoreductase n=1 Tax=unclassified Methylophaga TaxID=2629249 RepID=UPI000C92D158|nr:MULTISPECIES: TIGR03571 family LLM class oxidoreductase [unclassified Methylophaga]MBN45179.1 LLM class flavin-dependent oxidoreductase [Methylophaga sp.]|tara:strand:- start:111505 stop:112470 length:966 start_codon:yes stop_codon:yes gene_type:complete
MTIEHDFSEHPGFRRTFRKGHLTLGIFFPIEAFSGDLPKMQNQLELARVADEAGYAALWTRDVPVRDPYFGDVGQIYDAWVFTAYVAAVTHRIAIGTGSVILPLRAAVDLAKASASVDVLSGGRFLFGVASGDRPVEFSLYGYEHAIRGEDFRTRLTDIRGLYLNEGPIEDIRNTLDYPLELLPKPSVGSSVPILITGFAQQNLDWLAKNADGWMTYHRNPPEQKMIVNQWNEAVDSTREGRIKPVMQSLYLDLTSDPNAAATPIHLGYRVGRNRLKELLALLRLAGIAHVALNLKYGSRPALEVIEEITEHVLPHFPSHE